MATIGVPFLGCGDRTDQTPKSADNTGAVPVLKPTLDPMALAFFQLGQACDNYRQATGTWPAKIADLDGRLDAAAPIRKRIDDGSVVFVENLKNPHAERVIAHESSAPERGGWTLIAAGTVQKFKDKDSFHQSISPNRGDPEAVAMLDTLAKRYAVLKFYRDTAHGRVIATPDGSQSTIYELTSSIVFARPDRLRIETARKGPTAGMSNHYLVWLSGKEVKRRSTYDKFLSPVSTLDYELAGIAGGASFLVHGIVYLLLDGTGIPPYLSDLHDTKRLDDATVNGDLCHRIQGRSGAWNVIIAIDAKAGLVRKIELLNITAKSEITFNPVVDQPIPDADFEIKPETVK